MAGFEVVRSEYAKGRPTVVRGRQVFADCVGQLEACSPMACVEEHDLHSGPARLDHFPVVAVPTDLIDGTSLESSARRVKAHDVNWVP